MTWEHVAMITVLILTNYISVKIIDRVFERGERKKSNSLWK